MAFNNGIQVENKRPPNTDSLSKICMMAELEAARLPKPEIPATAGPILDKKEYYIEWWNLGDHVSAVESGMADTGSLRHLLICIMAGGKRTIVYIERTADKKVLWNRRTK